ncbi:unnamed protein product [Rhizophagus irregularis]|nr:unnamed protein product [Rhizophagus irregularis]CAB5382652.1 unnamed protein product [Rhizophagus irregularis]
MACFTGASLERRSTCEKQDIKRVEVCGSSANFPQKTFPEKITQNKESKMSDKVEVLNKTNTSDTSTIGELDKDRDNTPNRLTSDEKISSNQVATLANKVVKFIEGPDGTKLKIYSNSPQAWYTGDINPVTGVRPMIDTKYLAK